MDVLNKELLLELGRFTAQLRSKTAKKVVAGATSKDICLFVEQEIFSNGYKPAFPCTICINEQAAHFTPLDEEIVVAKGDVVKVDFGVMKDGTCVDNAFTIEVETNNHQTLLETNKKALDTVLEKISTLTSMHEVGAMVNKEAQTHNFQTIHNLSGHQIGVYDLHCGINVPSYANQDARTPAKGMLLAIEPFMCPSSNLIKPGKPSHICALQGKRPLRDIIAKKILTFIEKEFRTLPFAVRWLIKEERALLGLEGGFSKEKALRGLSVLKQYGIVHEYEILVSENGDVVSQFEDSVYFDPDDGKPIIVTRENA